MARSQEDVRTGPTKRFAEWLNANWDSLCTMTNWEVAEKLNYKAGNVVSMWRTGKTKVALDRMFDIADLLNVKVDTFLPLYFEQDLGDKPALWNRMQEILNRIVEPNEFKVIKALRAKNVNAGNLTKEQIDAIVKIATDPSFAKQAA